MSPCWPVGAGLADHGRLSVRTERADPQPVAPAGIQAGRKGQAAGHGFGRSAAARSPASTGTPAQLAEGQKQFGQFCAVCHGDAAIGTSLTRDLRRAGSLGDAKMWNDIVIGGALSANGMVSWKNELTPEQSEAVRLYVIKRANEDKALGD